MLPAPCAWLIIYINKVYSVFIFNRHHRVRIRPLGSILAVTVTLSLAASGFGTGAGGYAVAAEDVVNRDADVFSFPQNFEPPGDGRPEDTRGSGSRTGSCSATSALNLAATVTEVTDNGDAEGRMRAIAPDDNFGLTLQSHPTVFLNFDGDVAPSVMLRFEDEAGEYDERVMLPVDSERMIQGFALPSDRPPLEVGKNYKWTILVACDGQVNPYHPIFSGWVQRVAADESAATTLSQQPIEAQVESFMSRDYWYDAVALLDEARQAMPTDETVSLLWGQLLAFVDSK